jgi:hypothetical protein
MSHWAIYWLLWLVLGFCVPEAIALFNKTDGDSLSDVVWAWLKGRQSTRPVWLSPGLVADPQPVKWNHNTWRTWVVGSFLLWLFFHIVFGWFS